MLGPIKRCVMGLLPGPLRSRLRTWRIRRSVAAFPPQTVEHEYGGGKLKVHLADPLAAGWYDHDWPPLPEIIALRSSRLKPGARVFDAGAHQGVVALMLAREVGPSGQVVAVEASPHNAAVARTNRDLNGAHHLEIVQAAVADQPGTLSFSEGLNGSLASAGEWGRITVPAVSLDDLTEKYGVPDVVFIDVEGAEVLALAGATKALAAGADFFVECHVGCGLETLGGNVAKIFEHFPKDRYRLSIRRELDTEFRPLTAGDPILADRFFLLATRITA